MSKRIPLSGKESEGKYMVVDDEDYEWMKDRKWTISWSSNKDTYYGCTSIRLSKGVWKNVSAHRLIMNAETDVQIDHINLNGWDNRKENLRFATSQNNQRNRKKWFTDKTKSIYKGVSYSERNKNWTVIITVDRKNKYVGTCESEDMGGRLYDVAADYYFGEFAWLNFPGELEYSKSLFPDFQGDIKREITSRYIGVSLQVEGRWAAVIHKNRKKIHIGLFNTEKEAAHAYDVYARILFGDNAKLNFPDIVWDEETFNKVLYESYIHKYAYKYRAFDSIKEVI